MEGSQGFKVKDFDQTEHDHLRAKREIRDWGKREQFLKKLQHDKLMPILLM